MSNPSLQVALSDTFFDCVWQLPRHIQNKVQAFLTRFRQNPTSLGQHRERIHGTPNLYSVRIDLQYRGILAQGGKAVVLLHVDNHDAAYEWALRHHCEVNAGSGTLQIFETQTGIDSRTDAKPLPEEKGPIDELRDRQLRHLGVPESLFGLARTVKNDGEFEQISEQFPSEAQDAMYMLLAGYSFAEALDELALSTKEEQFDPLDIDSSPE